jgi:hypothetical protein
MLGEVELATEGMVGPVVVLAVAVTDVLVWPPWVILVWFVDGELWELPVSSKEDGMLARNPTAAAASTTPRRRATASPRAGEGALAACIACLPLVSKPVN